MGPEIEVAAGLIFRNGRLLITQRPWDAHLGGLWEFPGGKRSKPETFEECVRRELREELGVEVDVGELLGTVRHTYPENPVLLKFYRCRLVRGEPSRLGCLDLSWIRAEDLAAYAFPAADITLIRQLQSNPSWWGTAATWHDQSSPSP